MSAPAGEALAEAAVPPDPVPAPVPAPEAPTATTPGALALRWRRHRRRLRDYALLCRLDRPIGIWLLMWPMLWALWVAARGRPDLRVLAVMLAGVIVMRSAGCIVNDFADRNVDPHVRRTRNRPLAARRVSPYEAFALFGALIALALWLVTRLDALTVRLSLIGGALTVTYPFMKRVFPLPQFYLGLAFGWAVPMAFTAELGSVPRAGWLIFLVAVLWAAIYDTEYAMVDRDDDLRIGVRSTAILFGDLDRAIVGAMQLMMLLALALIGRSLGFGGTFFLGLGVAGLLFARQQWLIRSRAPADCFRAFLNNHYVGMAIFAGIVVQYLHNN